MADILTQLQDCLEQLSNQFTASFNYINRNAPSSSISSQSVPPAPGSPSTTTDPSQVVQTIQNSTTTTVTQTNSTNSQPQASPSHSILAPSQTQTQNAVPLPSAPPPPNDPAVPRPPSPTTFFAAQQELAQDLIKKTQQIEGLIQTLPGLNRSQEAQEVRIAELEYELKAVQAERSSAVTEREEAIEILEGILAGVRR